MTTTRCVVSATTPRSWVISTMAVPVFSFSSSMRSRICAWMVTSRAVVGSSAISTCGSQLSAMAIMTRWRMPPESWWGYSSSRRRASAMRTRSSISPARSRAARHDTPRWRTTFSAICVPTVSTGLRLVIGSWKIIEMRWPRRRFIASSLSAVSSSPSKRIEPEAMRPVSVGIRRRMESAVTDLPQPDSPTMPRVSPRASSNDTPSTARTTPSSVLNCVCRSRTWRIAFTAVSPAAGRAGRAARRPKGSPPVR